MQDVIDLMAARGQVTQTGEGQIVVHAKPDAKLQELTPRQQRAFLKIKKLWNLAGVRGALISIEMNRKVCAAIDALPAEDRDIVARHVF
jgi:hypothetical protein